MTVEKVSHSLKKVTEITHIAPLKQGYVQSDLAMSYPIRVRALLKALYALRRYDVSAFQSPVDTLGLISFEHRDQENVQREQRSRASR